MKPPPRFVSVPGDPDNGDTTLFRIVIGRVEERTADGSPALVRLYEPGMEIDRAEVDGRDFLPVLIPEEEMKSL